MEVNHKLKQRRKELGLTMLEVANMVGVSEATVSRWESGDIVHMRRDKIVSLANALRVPASFIMDDEEFQTMHSTGDFETAKKPDETLMYALWDGDTSDVTPEMLDKVREFARFVREEERRKANDSNKPI